MYLSASLQLRIREVFFEEDVASSSAHTRNLDARRQDLKVLSRSWSTSVNKAWRAGDDYDGESSNQVSLSYVLSCAFFTFVALAYQSSIL